MRLEVRISLSEGDARKEASYEISTPGSSSSRDDVQKLSDAILGVVDLQDAVERLCYELSDASSQDAHASESAKEPPLSMEERKKMAAEILEQTLNEAAEERRKEQK